ncbi:class I SAM-dependent methyltransferase [Alkalilimnicola sp. S0819]|uniref:class I SAM-dependent methyltransferase n=1 Tax=Alkalilimnicola sp. S0819 TaxID=2613922 RepID=UPI0012629BC3|nr:SAM-dependent methyltransferase [Alkalilimnicola sp. S0819]KAB7627306.1 SAM-dependent methyltransferase [Alkalilimnicola sp. S0819]MPQ16020.1 SAM-dependent methyltransferase [Alkalilimnicola sp. S0819]
MRTRLESDPPPPPAEAQALSEQLQARLRERMREAGGSLPFDAYMQAALYEPGLGYYSAGLAKLGPAGDFSTAPELAGLFSATLALQCAEVLARTGGVILELGAGTGRMAADILAELERREALPAQYLILEVSAHLRQVQRETLAERVPHLAGRVAWLERLPEQPIDGVLLANEVLDALPVKRFALEPDGGLREYHVTPAEEGFTWSLQAPGAALAAAVEGIQKDLAAPLGEYHSEWCPGLADWLTALAGVMNRGAMLFVDYGYPRREYYHPQRHMGTLVCHYRHRGHDNPLLLTGLQDITAFVDFTAAARAGLDAGLSLLGYNTQAQFLLGAGLPRLMEEALEGGDEHVYLQLAQQAKRLLLPGDMGERFKVLALGRDYPDALAGFSLHDQSERLGV